MKILWRNNKRPPPEPMKTRRKIALGCLIAVCLGIATLVVAAWKGVSFVSNLFSNASFTTGPPSSPPTIPDGYQVEGNVVYYTSNQNLFGNWVPNRKQLEGVDVKTFTTLDSYLRAKDATHVYYEGVAIPGADPITFRVSDTRYSGDASRTYYDGKVVEGAKGQDATTHLEGLDGSKARDKNHVYSNGLIIKGADPASFELIGSGRVARDKNDFYVILTEVEGSPMVPLNVDLPSFKLLISSRLITTGGEDPWNTFDEQMWAHDKLHYYVGEKACPIADPASFAVLPFGYAKDSKQAYFLDHVIADADLATFEVVSPDHEKNWATSFARYAKDAKRVYYHEKVLDGADAASFQRENERVFKDRSRRYQQGMARDDR